MSENEQTSERGAEREAPPEKKIELRGERPPGVIGEMQPEKALEVLRRMRAKHTREEDERIWAQFEPSLRDSKACAGNASSHEESA